MDQFSFACLAMVTWAFAVVQHRDQAFFRALAIHMTPKVNVGTVTCQELTSTIWAMATVGVADEGLLFVLAQGLLRRLAELKASELNSAACSLSALGFVQSEDSLSRDDLGRLLRAKLAVVQEQLPRSPTQAQPRFFQMPVVEGSHSGSSQSGSIQTEEDDRRLTLPPMLDVIQQRLGDWSMSKQRLDAYRMDYQRFRTGSGRGAKGEVSSIKTAPDEPCYIDLNMLASCPPSQKAPAADAAVATAEDASPSHDIASRLPQPLVFLHSTVSPAKLEAYRVGYQCFRAGGSSGARGEVSSTLAIKAS
jgi:hypothetical protein